MGLDVLTDLWVSTVNLSLRFRKRLPTVSESIPLIHEESEELVSALHEGNKDHVLEEGVDLIVVTLGAMQSYGATLAEIETSIGKVVRKNDAKTEDTHFVDEAGKVRRRLF